LCGLQNNIPVGTRSQCFHLNSPVASICTGELDPYFFHNIEQANLNNLIHWNEELKGNLATHLICFWCATSSLLDNYHIAIITSKSRSATDMSRIQCVEKPWESIGHLTTSSNLTLFGKKAETKLFPLK
jgi:hypothetical protein